MKKSPKSLSSGSITYLSVSCDIFLLPLRFFLVKLDFQVGAGNRVRRVPEVGLQVSQLFSPRVFFSLPLSPPPAQVNAAAVSCSQSLAAPGFRVHADWE